jgi:tetratricopeptide (TPR) repeat protein
VDEAITHYHKALDLDPKDALAHFGLGVALKAKGQVDEAIAEYQKAIACEPTFAQAYCNLGLLLRQQGRFADAVIALQRGDELGRNSSSWTYRSAQWLRETQRMVELDRLLPRILSGESPPADPGDRLLLANMCRVQKRLYGAATRFYADAFAARPPLAEDLVAAHRYNAACVAALAAGGVGADAAALGDKERTDLRRQALDWLRADLKAWAQSTDRVLVQRTLQHWQKDTDLASVRDKEALANLPQAERDAWQKLWGDVADLLEKSGRK